jgi:hypothetical protein
VSDGIAPFPFWDFAIRTAKPVLALLSVIGRISVTTHCFVRSYRFSYTKVAEGSAGQVPDAEVASGGKAVSGSKVYIYRHPLLLRWTEDKFTHPTYLPDSNHRSALRLAKHLNV